jgi:hypothetical protein
MALHRNIYWIGRQWAVTGYGLQAVDQRLSGKFDIEASRLWEDDLAQSLRADDWLNIADFDKALAVARKHFPEPPRKATPPEESVANLKEMPIEPLKPAIRKFEMRIEGRLARFVQVWRLRIGR